MSYEASLLAMTWYGMIAAAGQYAGIVGLMTGRKRKWAERAAMYGTLAAAAWALTFMAVLIGGAR